MSNPVLRATAGIAFGAALTASGVYLPSIIVSQMQLQNAHMLNVFLSASASSAIVVAVFERLDIAPRRPRGRSSIGWLGPYDANGLGGLMIGIGMSLTGACPGTVLVQLATGIKSGVPTALGGLVGGILYTRLGNGLKKDLSASGFQVETKADTIQSKLEVNPDRVLLAYVIICLAIVSMSVYLGLDRANFLLRPTIGGILIGGAQAVSLLLTGNAVGVSSAYEEAGRLFWYLITPHKQERRPSMNAITFALGILIGSATLAQLVPFPAHSTKSEISTLRALAGGCVMVFGARLAGGCTSGHGISGMANFSISSIVTVMAMFCGGIVTARLLA